MDRRPEDRGRFMTAKQRPPFFANRRLLDMVESGDIARTGSNGSDCFALAALIGLKEDQLRYNGPVAFWNPQLANLLGWSEKKLKLVRQKAVDAGLIEWTPGGRHVQPTYRLASGDEMTPLETPQRGRNDPASDPAKGAHSGDEMTPQPTPLATPQRGLPSTLLPDTYPPLTQNGGEGMDVSEEVRGALDEWERHLDAMGRPMTAPQRQATITKARKHSSTKAAAIIRDHIGRGRYVIDWPEPPKPRNAKPTRTEAVAKARFHLVNKLGRPEARDWPDDQVIEEYNREIENAVSKAS